MYSTDTMHICSCFKINIIFSIPSDKRSKGALRMDPIDILCIFHALLFREDIIVLQSRFVETKT